jgi:iron transport multicopper oxidase
VRDPESPYKHEFDEEIVLSVSDWYHEQMTDLVGSGNKNSTIAELPAPDSILLNNSRDAQVQVTPGTRYVVRVANMGATTNQYFEIMDHEMVVVEVDGVYTKPTKVQGIHLAPGQRYGLLMTAKNETSVNYPIITALHTVICSRYLRGHSLILYRLTDLIMRRLRLAG